MLKYKRVLTTVIAASMVLSLSACSLPFGTSKPTTDTKSDESGSKNMVSSAEDTKIQKVISDYIAALYSKTVDDYNGNSASGNVPENIKSFIADKTIKEADGNPEIAIHMPRFVNINGLVTTSYELLKSGKPEIEAVCIDKNQDTFDYFVKVNLKAKCLNESDFKANYKENPQNHIFTLSAAAKPADNLFDTIKVQARYDIVLSSVKGNFKIVSSKEANAKYKYNNRLDTLNNEFLTRLPYLFLKGAQDVNNDYVDKKDTDLFKKENDLIQSYFKRISFIDKDRTDLLRDAWSKGANQFTTQINNLDIPKNDALSKKGLGELMDIGTTYSTNFDISSFPIQVNMQRIAKLNSVEVLQHPAYSEKRKIYVVKLTASVVGINPTDEEVSYNYDYNIELNGDGTKITKMKLNECNKVDKK